MKSEFIKTPEKRRIIEELKEQFGIEDLPYLLIQTGKEKIRAFSGSLSKEDIVSLGKIANVEIVGLYIASSRDSEIRLSMDGLHLLKEQISKNILEINDEQLQLWLRGSDLPIQAEKGTLAIKYKGDFIGCGKSNGQTIFNYVPKERRLKS
jgi:NOL1/NOP2/fmu family ribosome biogenesis protein